jgi:hypothetical protein
MTQPDFDTVFITDMATRTYDFVNIYVKTCKVKILIVCIKRLSAEVGANNTNAAPFVCAVHPNFLQKIQKWKDDLQTKPTFHIVLYIYLMDKIVIAAFKQECTPPKRQSVPHHHTTLCYKRSLFLQFKEPDVVRLGSK